MEPKTIDYINKIIKGPSMVPVKKIKDSLVSSIKFLQNLNGIYVSEKCPNTLRELYHYIYDENGNLKGDDHACDSIRYSIIHLIDDNNATRVNLPKKIKRKL
jgi:phage terminase large subunit